MMKVVIDTNILINAASDENSVAFKIIQEVIAGRIKAFATHQTASENRQMVRELVKDRECKEFLEVYFSQLQNVKVYQPLSVVSDPDDNKLVESAVAAKADYLITNDREVLDLESYHGTKIISPSEFWAKYKADSSDDSSAWSDWAKMLLGS